MKKLLAILVLGLLLCNNSFAAGKGKGEVKLSDSTVRHFKDYLSGKLVKGERWKPLVFIVSSDSEWHMYYYCPYTTCTTQGIADKVRECERETDVDCGVFARRRLVIWDNGNDFPRKERTFNSKWDLEKIKSELTRLGFYGGTTSTTKPKITKKTTTTSSDNSSDIVSQLMKLNKLFHDGVLTQEEFDKAKKKLLN